MSSSSAPDILEIQQAYMAHFYSLFETFMNHPLNANPLNTPNSQKDTAFISKVTENTLSKDFFECRLCGNIYDTPFQLAQHSCPQMAQTAFQCQDCHKAFGCSANLASHQRWHRPKSTSSRKVQRQIHLENLDKSNGVDLSTGGVNATSSDRQPVKTSLKVIRSPLQFVQSPVRKTPSFSIDSILETECSTPPVEAIFACFRCGAILHSQGDFEDHIIDHLLCVHEK
ncbi:hypothetical protein Aperf_G00000097088 [Anoplocephala perfoliata]